MKRNVVPRGGLLMAVELVMAAGLLLLMMASGAAQAQAVQLPTYSHFGTSTTVKVPDRGSMSMGGIKSSSSSESSKGVPGLPFKNRSVGSSSGASSVSTSVYVHDFDAMEEELLGTSAPSSSSSRPSNPASREYAGSIGGSNGNQRRDLGVPEDHSAKRTTKRKSTSRARSTAAVPVIQPNAEAWQKHSKGGNPALNADLVVAAAESDGATFGSVPSDGVLDPDQAKDGDSRGRSTKKQAGQSVSSSRDSASGSASKSLESQEKRVKSLLKKGKAEEKAGRSASAMLYYEEAAAMATGEMAEKVQQRIDRLNGKEQEPR